MIQHQGLIMKHISEIPVSTHSRVTSCHVLAQPHDTLLPLYSIISEVKRLDARDAKVYTRLSIQVTIRHTHT